MDVYKYAMIAFTALLSGLIYALLVKKAKVNKNIGLVVFVALLVTLRPIGQSDTVKNFIMPIFDQDYAFNQLLKNIGGKMLNDPIVQASIATLEPSQVSAFVRKNTELGLKRLSDEETIQWNKSRLMLAKGSLKTCAGFLNGNLQQEDLFAALKTLKETDIKQFLALTHSALKKELTKQEYTKPKASLLDDALQKILDPLDEKSLNTVSKVLEASQAASDEDACFTVKTLHQETMNLPAPLQAPFIRLAWIYE